MSESLAVGAGATNNPQEVNQWRNQFSGFAGPWAGEYFKNVAAQSLSPKLDRLALSSLPSGMASHLKMREQKEKPMEAQLHSSATSSKHTPI